MFQSVTGDTSDAAIIISTLILASVFTPVRKWLEGIVERRFKAQPAASPGDALGTGEPGEAEWEARMTAVALRVVRTELDSRAGAHRPELPARDAAVTIGGMIGEEGFEPSTP